MLKFPNQITSYIDIDVFENLIMNKGALTWVEMFWSYNAKVIDYWTIFLININKIIIQILLKAKGVLGVVGK